MFVKLDHDNPVYREDHGDEDGPIQFMTVAEGWVMVRRPHGVPWVEPLAIWHRRPLETDAAPLRAAYAAAFGE